MEHSLRITLTKEGIYLLTSAGGKFELWKMVEKIRTCGRMRIDGGHNVICDIVVLDVVLRNYDVASSYNGGVGSSSSTSSQTTEEFSAKNGFEEEKKEEEGGEGFLPMNLPNT